MLDLHWKCYQFHQFETHQLYELIKFRIDIFVVEQQCPYSELDDKDNHLGTRHLLAYSNSSLIAYARLLPPNLSYAEASIGRFAVIESERRRGIGTDLLNKSINEINRIWPNSSIRISAQDYLQHFYENAGFEKVSDMYLEDDIPHIEMLKV